MSIEIMPIIFIAAFTGIVHTLLGPDHYLPFIALAKSQSWPKKTTLWITSVCGLGHILSSVVLGYLALGLRMSLGALKVIDSFRSDFAAWALIAFGLTYFIWGLKKLYKGKGEEYNPLIKGKFNVALWAIFVIFVVGPCEPLFFLMTYPSLVSNPLAMMLLVSVFGVATIATMLTVVLGASYGLNFVRSQKVLRYAPAVTGMVIMFCGIGIKFLGL